LYAAALAAVSACGVPASAQTPSASNIVAKPIAINSSLKGPYTESGIAAKFDLDQKGSPLEMAILAALGKADLTGNPCLANHEALILHFASWGVDPSAGPQLASSNYYVYHATSDAKGCHFQQAPRRASNSEPLLYGDQSARFVGISVFQSAPPQPVTISYRAYSTAATAQNVQDLGALVQALLGLTAATGGAAAASQPTVYVAAGSIAGYSKGGHVRLPFDFNISYGLSVPSATQAGAGAAAAAPAGGPAVPKMPDATVGVNYSAQIPAPVGWNNPQFSLLAGNQLPGGLSLSATGQITGMPRAPGTTPFSIGIASGAQTVQFRYTLAVVGPAGPLGGASGAGTTGQQTSGSATTPSSGNTSPVDCTSISKSPCALTYSFHSDKKEWWDISIGVTTPGVREQKFSAATPPVSTYQRHTELYAMFDIYPAAYWVSKDTTSSFGAEVAGGFHLELGLPASGKPFYMPYFGGAANVTRPLQLERLGFPVPLSFFIGVVDLRETAYLGGTPPDLVPTRKWRRVFGFEVPISSIVSKIGGKSSSSSSSGK